MSGRAFLLGRLSSTGCTDALPLKTRNRARPGSRAHSALRGWSRDGGSSKQGLPLGRSPGGGGDGTRQSKKQNSLSVRKRSSSCQPECGAIPSSFARSKLFLSRSQVCVTILSVWRQSCHGDLPRTGPLSLRSAYLSVTIRVFWGKLEVVSTVRYLFTWVPSHLGASTSLLVGKPVSCSHSRASAGLSVVCLSASACVCHGVGPGWDLGVF